MQVINIGHAVAFETRGQARGSCGHRHPDLASALRCLRHDQRECDANGSFSDRRIVPLEPTLERHRLQAIDALREARRLYSDGALAAASRRLGYLPEIDVLARSTDVADVARWVKRARAGIARQQSGEPATAALVLACLRAAINAVAGTDATSRR